MSEKDKEEIIDPEDDEMVDEELDSEEESEDVDDDVENDDEDSEEEEEIDYKAEYERIKAQDDKKSGALAEERRRRREAEAKARGEAKEDEEEEDDEEEPSEVEALVDKKLQGIQRQQAQDIIEDAIDAVSANADERKLIEYHFDRFYDGSTSKRAILEMVDDAALLANRQRFIDGAEKSARQAIAKKQAIRGISGRIRSKTVDKSNDKLTNEERSLAKDLGMSPKAYLKYKNDPRLS